MQQEFQVQVIAQPETKKDPLVFNAAWSAKSNVRAAGALSGGFGNGVLFATVGATFKLFLVCGLVGWLLHTKRLTEDSAPVLSKASTTAFPIRPTAKVAGFAC